MAEGTSECIEGSDIQHSWKCWKMFQQAYALKTAEWVAGRKTIICRMCFYFVFLQDELLFTFIYTDGHFQQPISENLIVLSLFVICSMGL